MVLLLVFMQLTRDLFAIAKFLLFNITKCHADCSIRTRDGATLVCTKYRCDCGQPWKRFALFECFLALLIFSPFCAMGVASSIDDLCLQSGVSNPFLSFHSLPPPEPHPLSPAMRSGKRCKLPTSGLGGARPPNVLWWILSWKSCLRWHKINNQPFISVTTGILNWHCIRKLANVPWEVLMIW